jgi:hypothetical protein
VVVLDALSSLQIIKAVPNQDSAAFKKNLRTDLQMQTSSWDKTPYTMYSAVYHLALKSSRKVLLAGNAQGSAGWTVDNFLLLEVFNTGGKLLKRVVIGNHEPVKADNAAIEKLGDNKFGFVAGEIDITKLLPVNETFLLRASTVDYGGVGNCTDVFLFLPPAVAPPRRATRVPPPTRCATPPPRGLSVAWRAALPAPRPPARAAHASGHCTRLPRHHTASPGRAVQPGTHGGVRRTPRPAPH